MNFLILLVLSVASGVQSKIDQREKFQNLILDTINEPASSFEPCDENLILKATFADLIEIKRRGFFHWCVFVGAHDVIQLNNPQFDKLTTVNAFDNFTGYVELRNLIQLAKGDFCRINNKVSESKRRGLPVLSEDDTIKLMEGEYKRNVTFYNVFTHNCEHFATKLKFGVPFSSQVCY